MTSQVITRSGIVQYGLLALPVAFAGFPLYVLAPDYYATHYGVSLGVLGVLLLALRAFDALQDPVIGMMSDRWRKVAGFYMPLAGALLCVGVYGLFNAQPLPPTLWFAVCMALSVSAYSILSINLNTLGALWTNDPLSQTRIAAAREGFGLLGLVIAVSLPVLLGKMVESHQVFIVYSLVLALLMLIALSLFGRWLGAQQLQAYPLSQLSGFLGILCSLTIQTRRLFLVYAISMLASSIPAVLVIFFVRDVLGSEALTGIFLLLYFLAGAATMPVWKRVSIHYGKERAWLLSMVLAVGSFIWAFFLSAGDAWQYGLICVLSGMALGADLTLPPSILADQIHGASAEPRAATYYALLALLSKASLAAASAVALPLLDMSGYVPAGINASTALLMLSLIYAAIPCFLKVGAGVLLHRFFIHSNLGASHETNTINRHYRSSHHV